MKSPLLKLKKLGLHKSETEEILDRFDSPHAGGLNQSAKDVEDMKTCYDGLLSAAAATANCAYEFSESLLEIGYALLETTVVYDNGETGEALSLLGRAQIELQKLFDDYRSQIISTVTNPSETFLTELRKVEEMKLQCDEKRDLFEHILGQRRENSKSRHGKLDASTSEQLKTVCEEYDEVARLFIFRVQSLKRGQSRSLLTLAANHHAAQLNLFRRGLHSLEALDVHIRSVAQREHISYGDGEEFEGSDGEMPGSIAKFTREGTAPPGRRSKPGSYSAPLHAEKFDHGERRLREAAKFDRHVLPTPPRPPDDAKGGSSRNAWHSSPLDVENNRHRKAGEGGCGGKNRHVLPLPPPAAEAAVGDSVQRHSFSGPLASKQPAGAAHKPPFSGQNSYTAAAAASPPKVSELHELPRPPDSSSTQRYSGPFASGRDREALPAAASPSNNEGCSQLPIPQLTLSRSFSILPSSQRSPAFSSGKLLRGSEAASAASAAPPLSPSNAKPMISGRNPGGS